MMDGRQFAKLCRDCNIVDKKGLSVNDTDIVFAKVAVEKSSLANSVQLGTVPWGTQNKLWAILGSYRGGERRRAKSPGSFIRLPDRKPS